MRRQRRRRYRTLAWCAAIVLAGVAFNVHVALRQESLTAYVREALAIVLASPFTTEGTKLSWNGALRIDRFRVLEEEGGGSILQVHSARVFPRLGSLLRGRFAPRLVVLDGVELRLARASDGRLNLEGVLRPITRRLDLGDVPEVLIRGLRIRYEDSVRTLEEEVDEIELSFARQRDGVYSIQGDIGTQAIASAVELSGRLHLGGSRPSLDLRVRAFKVGVGERTTRWLPAPAAEFLERFDARGSIDVDGEVSLEAEGGFVVRRIGGRLIQCALVLPGLRAPVESLDGTFSIRGRTIDLEGISAELGGGHLHGNCAFELAGTGLSPAAWRGTLGFDGVPVDSALFRELGVSIPRQLEPLSFAGRAGGVVEVTRGRGFPPRLEDLDITLELEGIDASYQGLPYDLTGLRGQLRLEAGRLRVEKALSADCGGALVTVSSGVAELSRGGAVDVMVKVGGAGLRLDERCRSMLPEKLVPIWDSLELAGHVKAAVRVERPPAGASLAEPEAAPFHVAVELVPQDVRLAYRRFPYEVTGITGEIRYDSRRDMVELVELAGHHGEHAITASGAVAIGEEVRFRLDLRSDDLECDSDLLDALGPRGREIVQQFGFSGRMKAAVVIQRVPGGEVDVRTELELIEGAIRPEYFPYPLALAGGKVVLYKDELAKLEGFRTPPGTRPRILFDGSVMLRGPETRLAYELEVADLDIDRTLLEALPPQLSTFVERFGLEGSFAGSLEGFYIMDADDPARNKIYYTGSDIRSGNAGVDFGIRIRDMDAAGRFVGGHEPERPHHFWGEVVVKSAWFNRLHLTGGDISFHFGRPHHDVLAHRASRPSGGRSYRIPRQFLERLTEDRVRNTFQMSVHSEDVYGGKVDGFLFVDTGELGDIGGDFQAEGLELSRAARDVFGVDARDIAGKAGGHVRFAGQAGDLNTLRGEGLGEIREARLAELPLFLDILMLLDVLKVVRFNLDEVAQRTFFEEVVLPYKIENGSFRSTNLAIKSPAITLVGDGKLDFQGNLDLVLRPQVVDVKIPVWDQLVGLIKDALFRVLVRGDLARPRVAVETALGLLELPIDAGQGQRPARPLPSDLKDGG